MTADERAKRFDELVNVRGGAGVLANVVIEREIEIAKLRAALMQIANDAANTLTRTIRPAS